MRKTAKYLLPVILILMIGGCAVGPNFVEPGTETKEQFRFQNIAGEYNDTLAWWELFNDPILEALIDTALKYNKDVRIAASRLEQAWAAVGYYRADMWPKLDVSAGAMRGNFFGQSIPLTNNFYGVAQLSWELDFWGKYRRLTEAARAELIASEYGMRSVQISLISSVAVNYFYLLGLKENLRISQNTLESRDSALWIINQRFKEGIIPEIDVNQAEIQRSIAAAAIPIYERGISQQEHVLSILIGGLPDAVETGDGLFDLEKPEEIPAGLPSQLLERRPDIMQAEQVYRAQNARVGAAVAMRFPSISLTGLLGLASADLSSFVSNGLAWSIGGDLLGPLFHFNKNKRRADIERFRAEEMLYHYELTVLQAFREVEDALVNISTLKEELEARRGQYEAALSAEYLSQMRYDRGVTSYLEVLETQRSSFDAQLIYAEVYQDLLSAYVELYRALGGGWITPEEKALAEEETQ
jgi:multidrug efflux system outer membrane protein